MQIERHLGSGVEKSGWASGGAVAGLAYRRAAEYRIAEIRSSPKTLSFNFDALRYRPCSLGHSRTYDFPLWYPFPPQAFSEKHMAKKRPASNLEPDDSADEMNFEQSLQQVERIVASLESGQLGLSESLAKYEQGIGALKRCHGLLDAAEQRINVLAGFDAEGNPVLEPMDDKPAVRNDPRAFPEDKVS
jgi:exodeoxyribonuclease VII small subunit